MDYYVYEHTTLQGDRFYIGKGKGYRYKDGKMRNDDWHKKTEYGFKYNILMDKLTNDEARELESFVIDEIGIDKLCNKILGAKLGCKRPDVAVRNKNKIGVPNPKVAANNRIRFK